MYIVLFYIIELQCAFLFCLYVYEVCLQSGPHGRPPFGEWATLYKY